jgi:hypothetical protein
MGLARTDHFERWSFGKKTTMERVENNLHRKIYFPLTIAVAFHYKLLVSPKYTQESRY